MAYSALAEKQYDNIVPFSIVMGTKDVKPKSPKARENHGGGRVAGQSSEVYAFRTEEEIKDMIDMYNKHIEEAPDEHHRQIAARNKLLFVVGINVGLRASDLATLKWSFFLDSTADGKYRFKDFYVLQPKKTRKTKKFVKLFFNNTVKKAIVEYLNGYPTDNLDEYLFASREGGAISTKTLYRAVKNTAKEVGIKQNIGSHSLRKSWAFHVWRNAKDKDRALVMLMRCFNHSSTAVTMRYIGIMDDEIKDVYESVELGFDFI